MKSVLYLVLAAALGVGSTSPKAATPKSSLVVAPCDAGEHRQFEVVHCDIELRNTGDKPIQISRAEAASKADSIQESVVVAPKSTAYLTAQISLLDAIGDTQHTFRFRTDEPGLLALRGSHVNAFVTTVLDQGAPSVDFGIAQPGRYPEAKTIALSSREVRNFQLTGIIAKPDYVDATIEPDKHTVKLALREDAPWGLLADTIKFKTNSSQQPEAWIRFTAHVQGDVVADSNPFSLGLMRTNNKNNFLVRISSSSGKAFKVGAVKLEKVKGTTSVADCIPAAVNCHLIRLAIAGDQTMGRIGGTMEVALPELKRVLPIRLEGILLSPDVQVHDASKEMEKAQNERGAAQSRIDPAVSANAQRVDVKQVIKQTVAKASDTAPSGTGPLLRWTVANQALIYGYIIYRADAEAGPFLRVNKEIIKAADDAGDTSGSYQWRDNATESGKTYWYQIGMLNRDGSKKDLTGAQKILAK